MKKKKEPPKEIQDLEEFQAEYGPDWQRITQMPAFRAGLQLLNVRELDKITSLSEEDIEKHGLLILSQLVGLLRHENAIFNLHNEKTFQLPTDEDVIYISPEEESAHIALREKFQKQAKK